MRNIMSQKMTVVLSVISGSGDAYIYGRFATY